MQTTRPFSSTKSSSSPSSSQSFTELSTKLQDVSGPQGRSAYPALEAFVPVSFEPNNSLISNKSNESNDRRSSSNPDTQTYVESNPKQGKFDHRNKNNFFQQEPGSHVTNNVDNTDSHNNTEAKGNQNDGVIKRTKILETTKWWKVGYNNIFWIIMLILVLLFGVNMSAMCIAYCIAAGRDDDEDEDDDVKKKKLMRRRNNSVSPMATPVSTTNSRSQAYEIHEEEIRNEDLLDTIEVVPSLGSGSRPVTSGSNSQMVLGSVEVHRHEEANGGSNSSSATTTESRILTVVPRGEVVSGNSRSVSLAMSTVTTTGLGQKADTEKLPVIEGACSSNR